MINILPEKNGDLVVNGQPAASFIPEFSHDKDELRDFEYAAYEAYEALHGPGACDRDGINYLQDLFGKSYGDRVYTRRWALTAKHTLSDLEDERNAIEARIKKLKEFIENPTPDGFS